MIQQVLFLIVNQLNAYILSLKEGTQDPQVVAGNMGLTTALGGHETYMDEKVVVSIVNVMEEASMKNATPYRSASLNPEIENPPVFINLFLLFAANFNSGSAPDSSPNGQNYYNAMIRLSQVIEFFQGKNQFTLQNAPLVDLLPETLAEDETALLELKEVCLNMELVSLTFEQINYLWGSLGGKQLPFVLYKAHVVPVKRTNLLGRGSLIQDIQSSSVHLSSPGA